MFFIYLWIATQIIAEMLPISSSGHLQLLQNLFKRKDFENRSLYYLLHLPTFIIIGWYFAPQWFSFIFHDQILDIKPIVWVICADFITGILFLIKNSILKPFASSEAGGRVEKSCTFLWFLILGFLITACALLKTGSCAGNKLITSWDFSDAILLGLAQAVALLPGISRLAFTCFAGCLLGFSLMDAFCLSWLLQMPLMLLAIAKSMSSRTQRAKLKQLLNPRTCLAIIVSSGISVVVLLLVVKIIQLNVWYILGWYMMLPILVVLWMLY